MRTGMNGDIFQVDDRIGIKCWLEKESETSNASWQVSSSIFGSLDDLIRFERFSSDFNRFC